MVFSFFQPRLTLQRPNVFTTSPRVDKIDRMRSIDLAVEAYKLLGWAKAVASRLAAGDELKDSVEGSISSAMDVLLRAKGRPVRLFTSSEIAKKRGMHPRSVTKRISRDGLRPLAIRGKNWLFAGDLFAGEHHGNTGRKRPMKRRSKRHRS
jgi:hypothetical protein